MPTFCFHTSQDLDDEGMVLKSVADPRHQAGLLGHGTRRKLAASAIKPKIGRQIQPMPETEPALCGSVAKPAAY
jgi:hypothetical protein